MSNWIVYQKLYSKGAYWTIWSMDSTQNPRYVTCSRNLCRTEISLDWRTRQLKGAYLTIGLTYWSLKWTYLKASLWLYKIFYNPYPCVITVDCLNYLILIIFWHCVISLTSVRGDGCIIHCTICKNSFFLNKKNCLDICNKH